MGRLHLHVFLLGAIWLLSASAAHGSHSFGEGATAPLDEEQEGVSWLHEFAPAAALAKSSGKDLLVDFTGSDWCKWCKTLDAEVFSQQEFRRAMDRDYVLVEIDLPRSDAARKQVPNLSANRALANKYGVRRYPTVILMTADGDICARTGYQRGGWQNYLQHVKDLRSTGRAPLMAAKELAELYRVAKPEEREEIASKALVQLAGHPRKSPATRYLIPASSHFLKSDPENKAGKLAKALELILKCGQAGAEHLSTAETLDADNRLGLREWAMVARIQGAKNDREWRATAKAINEFDKIGFVIDPDAAWQIYVTGAEWNDRYLRDTAQAKILARKAKPYVKNKPAKLARVQGILKKL